MIGKDKVDLFSREKSAELDDRWSEGDNALLAKHAS